MPESNSQILDVLTREGVLIKVSVKYWRGCKKLKPEDLGLDPENLSDRLISLGQKRLLPREATAALALVENRAHAFIEHNTFPFLNGLAHFVPNAKLEEVSSKLHELEGEFWTAKQHFVDDYSEQRESALEEWRTMSTKLVAEPDRFIAAIEASFPPPQKLERTFGFEVQLFQIAAPERLELDLVSLGDQEKVIEARQQAARNASERIRRDTETFVADCVATLREQTSELCEEMLSSINNSDKGVHQKTLNRLRRFIDQFRQMNFVNDSVMEEELERVRKELLSRTAKDYRGNTHAQSQLKQGLVRLADQARQMARADATELVQRFGELGRRKFTLAA